MPYELIVCENFEQIPTLTFRTQGFLFNRAEQLRTQSSDFILFFYWKNLQQNTIDASLHVFIKNNQAFSPIQSSFGGVEFYEEIPQNDLENFLNKCVKVLENQGIQSLRIIQFPDCFFTKNQLLNDVLVVTTGFQEIIQELNQQIFISDSLLETKIHISAKRRLVKCVQQGYVFEESSLDYLPEFYELLVASRQRKNTPISLGFEQVKFYLETFPDSFKFFTVRDKKTIIAACIGVIVSAEILYYFLPTDHSEYLQKSPSVMLVDGLYQYCQQQNFTILDLGISTSKGNRNEGLIRFKKNLGAEECLKRVYWKNFYPIPYKSC
jgi:Acetyltransferase (GNAT) domain